MHLFTEDEAVGSSNLLGRYGMENNLCFIFRTDKFCLQFTRAESGTILVKTIPSNELSNATTAIKPVFLKQATLQ
jgi:hypothetical protein